MRPSSLVLLAWLVFSWFFTNGGPVGQASTAWAGETWRQEFNELCASTDEAVTLTTEQLSRLVGRCAALRIQIEQLAQERSTESKVYLKRLDMCRGLYDYVLRMREKK